MRGITANNIAYVTSDPLYASSASSIPAVGGVNWGYYANPKVDGLIDAAKKTST